ncbi:PREDICTED: gametogenetin-binding protein 2-like [Ceratosolen solmsi marchali]|uniref:Gametogenetin-binding protein 2-like n=1 Tax=Ceratosolen solmsi marchali TaxID=326594 RepID=A0AAJ7E0L1_9HYME|nr:PREDICTED: gametogenetin-binding protein 2-like [Ceratosolen solmsi marchali]
MARLVNIWQSYLPPALEKKQMPLIIDKNLVMVMDISGLKALRESPLVQGKQLDEFSRKLNLLNIEEKKASFEVACKDILSVLDQTVPCIGCRRSVERLFYDLSNLNSHPALDPIIITSDGMLTIEEEVLQSSQRLCTLLQGHSTRLNDLVEQQPRNKKSRRCTLHSLEIQRMRPPPNAWKEVWDCMEHDCLKEITFIDADTLDATLNTYLHKHKFCSECRTKVLLASSLLTTESDPIKEKGYVSSLYADIKRCTGGHIHLPLNIDYIGSIIRRAQPELMGRERHAKTLEIAQEEVLTCLGICVAERLNRIFRRLKEEEIIVKVLAAVAIDTLSRNFQMAIEYKQGVTQLEVLYKELKKEEVFKQQRREKLRLKRKKKKERRFEIEEKENQCLEKENECELQVLDTKNKVPLNCNCPDCKKNTHSNEKHSKSQVLSFVSNKKEEKKKKKIESKVVNNNTKEVSKREKINKTICVDKQPEPYKTSQSNNKHLNEWQNTNECTNSSSSDHLIDALMDTNKRYTMWIEVKKRLNTKVINRNCRSSSEYSSQDYGYSSEHNVSSSSLPSTPEGSELACADGCCNLESECSDVRPTDKLIHLNPSLCILKKHGGGLTLSQMLENSCLSEDEDNHSYIPLEEILEFKSRMCQVTEKRKELRQMLKKRFAMLCSHKSFTIPH